MEHGVRDEEFEREEAYRRSRQELQERALDIARRSNITKLLSSIVGALGVVAAGITIVVGLGSFSVRSAVEELTSKSLEGFQQEIETSHKASLRALSDEVKELAERVGALGTVTDNSKLAAEITDVAQSVNALDTRLAAIEDSVLDSPEKALAIPLLRNEVEGVKNANALEIAALRAEVARIYDLNKWFVGLMLTMALGIIGLAVSNFVKPAKQEAD